MLQKDCQVDSPEAQIESNASDMQLHSFGTRSNMFRPNRLASCASANSAPRYTRRAVMTSSDSGGASFGSLVASPRAGLYAMVKMPFVLLLLDANIAVRDTS